MGFYKKQESYRSSHKNNPITHGPLGKILRNIIWIKASANCDHRQKISLQKLLSAKQIDSLTMKIILLLGFMSLCEAHIRSVSMQD